MEQQTVRIDIEGMTCGSCVRHVRRALEELDGVEVGNVEIGSAEIEYDSSTIGLDDIIESIKDQGYTVAK